MPENPDTCDLIEQFASNPGAESRSTEFKSKEIVESTEGKKKLIRTLAALSNAGGGSAIIGVRREDGDLRIQSFEPGDETRQTLTHVARGHTYPPVDSFWSLSFDDFSGKHILRIDVERSGRDPVEYTGGSEPHYPVRHEDNTEKMSHREIVEFVKETGREGLHRPNRSVPVQRTTSVKHDPPAVENYLPTTTDQGRVVIAAPNGHTVVFGGGILKTRSQKSTVFSVSHRPRSLDGYSSVPELLKTASECLGASKGRRLGYALRVGDVQVVGNSSESLIDDLSSLGSIQRKLTSLSTEAWSYGPSITVFTPTDFGILWFAVQDEGTMSRWDLELLCPDVPVDDKPVKEFFSTVASKPRFYDHKTGTRFVEVTGKQVPLQNPTPVSRLGDPELPLNYIVANNPLYNWPDNAETVFDPPLPDHLKHGIEGLPRLPFSVSGGYRDDMRDPSYSLNTINYCYVEGTHPTLLVQSFCWQRGDEKDGLTFPSVEPTQSE